MATFAYQVHYLDTSSPLSNTKSMTVKKEICLAELSSTWNTRVRKPLIIPTNVEIRNGGFFKAKTTHIFWKPCNLISSQIKGVSFSTWPNFLWDFLLPWPYFFSKDKKEALRIRQITRPCLFNEGDGLTTVVGKGVLVTSRTTPYFCRRQAAGQRVRQKIRKEKIVIWWRWWHQVHKKIFLCPLALASFSGVKEKLVVNSMCIPMWAEDLAEVLLLSLEIHWSLKQARGLLCNCNPVALHMPNNHRCEKGIPTWISINCNRYIIPDVQTSLEWCFWQLLFKNVELPSRIFFWLDGVFEIPIIKDNYLCQK